MPIFFLLISHMTQLDTLYQLLGRLRPTRYQCFQLPQLENAILPDFACPVVFAPAVPVA